MTDARPDLVVLGAGILGCALTFHLNRTPSLRTLTIDARPEGSVPSATASSAGILSYPGWDAWDIEVVRETASEYRSLSEQRGRGEFQIGGGIRLTRSESGARWLERASRALLDASIVAEMGSAAGILGSTNLPDKGEFAHALWVPEDATFSAPGIATAYAELAHRAGAEFLLLARPPSVRRIDIGFRLTTAERTIDTARLVLACGAWTKRMLEELGGPLPLAPFRTQACRARPRPLLAPFPAVHDIDANVYARPSANGRLVAGNGTDAREVDPDRADPHADEAFQERMRTEIGSIVPDAGNLELEAAWAGVCVASPDRYPVVGPVPGVPGLYVATGFNGFGAMRAGALGRRLADGIISEEWGALAPADPRRFTGSPSPFDPRPEFPLEGDDERRTGMAAKSRVAPDPIAPDLLEEPVTYRNLVECDEADRLSIRAMSEWFDPFLHLFLRNAVATGGVAEIAENGREVVGVYLRGADESVGSLFTRIRPVAERFLERYPANAIYCEARWRPEGDPIEILAADLRDWSLDAPLRNPVRIADRADLEGVRQLMHEVGGSYNEAWVERLPLPEETCFLSESAGRVIGMSWLTRSGRYARGHSFVVHPRFRGLGIGTDLLRARMLWLQRNGVLQVVSEIYDGNIASGTAAERAGMARVGTMYRVPAAPADV